MVSLNEHYNWVYNLFLTVVLMLIVLALWEKRHVYKSFIWINDILALALLVAGTWLIWS